MVGAAGPVRRAVVDAIVEARALHHRRMTRATTCGDGGQRAHDGGSYPQGLRECRMYAGEVNSCTGDQQPHQQGEEKYHQAQFPVVAVLWTGRVRVRGHAM